MIVIDLETSGVDFVHCGIWQIGAIDFETKEEYSDECRIDDEDICLDDSSRGKKLFEVIGKTEEQLRDKTKQGQKEMLIKFFKWCEKSKMKNFMCENPQFDESFLEIKARKYGLKFPFHYRAFDLHSIAQAKYLAVKGKFAFKEHYTAGLSMIVPFCGIEDNRGFHNALEDAKLAAECLHRVLYGKGFLEEYEKYPIPEYLKINNPGVS